MRSSTASKVAGGAPVCCMAVTVAPAPDRIANPVLDLALEVPDASDEAVYLPAIKVPA